MSLTTDNCKVVYLRLVWPVAHHINPDILKVAAKFQSKELSVWVKPTKLIHKKTTLYRNGLIVKNGELFLQGQKLETVDLKTALMKFHEFITSAPKPILLVTHSSGVELQLLSRAIRETKAEYMFNGVIQRVVDTVPIFEKRFPSLKSRSQLTLEVLMSYMTGKQPHYRNVVLKTSYYLKCLMWLLTNNSVSTSELIENSESYENWLFSFQCPLPLFRNNAQRIEKLIPFLSLRNVKNLKKAKIPFATLEELSQKDDPEILRRYVEKQCAENNVRTIPLGKILEIFKFLKNPCPHDHGDHSVNTGQEGSVVDEPGSSMTSHGKQYNDHSLLRQQEELVDDPDSVMEELEAPYNSDHFRVRQETQRANYSSTGDQENSSDILDLLTEEQGVRIDYDYPWSSVPRELAHSTDFYTEGQETVNDYPFSYQLDEATMDWNSFVEVQETPDDGTYPFTSEEEERLADAYSMIEESGALYDNDHSLTGHQRERGAAHDYQFTGYRDELIEDQREKDRELLQEWHEKFHLFY
ncbi:uncharacterized protein [Venturia canescens]|uniref:uncharacterized protein isoform X1 n=1 Tax=Venturia canescens TaxID=32260 RepID=UPI001C9BC303|nr:uncharacterized protein LOC122406427 isoform X1 [Venturia canescens]XP_043267819.1 uncharacterized protein LOC122406427 isoform X2 [Venturia canescens]